MSVLRRLPLIALPVLLAACGAENAASTETARQDQQDDQVVVSEAGALTGEAKMYAEKFSKLGVKVISVKPSDIDGLMEVQTSGGVLFVSPKGDYFLAGTLYHLKDDGSYEDVLAKRQAPLNAAKIEAFSDSMIEFKAPEEKYVVTVFTDITCSYCVKLHGQMQEYNDLGITVRYMAYPRQGATGMIADQMAAIWASDDPQTAMHNSKLKRELPEIGDDFTKFQEIIKQHYILGRELGINGTPAIFLPSGEMVGGYVPPEQLAQRLAQAQ
ncbi:thiol:disulfide interchange protein [Vibrio galatheae]|uniref:Thiol:disulfide interchange protein n=1 Tax=Vibrio galatheae TaxID=579748 RepID=A0A0F4NL80_9VIBR|nr:thioredoxin fold domain-containing protein [Vibrio galatheae]KJY83624.1 thiol:disulfide interchange protein [Vibrio galatheae]